MIKHWNRPAEASAESAGLLFKTDKSKLKSKVLVQTEHKENPLSDSEKRLLIFEGQQSENSQVINADSSLEKSFR
jgi:hypothetical protein